MEQKQSNTTTKHLKQKAMKNKKEPLMSAEKLLINYHNNLPNDWLFQNREVVGKLMKEYANYVTQWHLNNAKEFVADEAKVHQHSRDYKVGTIGKIVRQKIMISEVHKQSIHTAIDNYIKINLQSSK